jgi:serine phosphatase RsbU (regulator of sigma subunit)
MNRSRRPAWLWVSAEWVGPWGREALLVLVDAAAISIAISAASEPGSRAPDALAYTLGLAMAAALFGRRRWPVGTLIVTLAVFTLYAVLDYPGFVPAVPLAVPLYTAAAAGSLAWPIAVSALEVVSPLIYRLRVVSEPVARVVNDAVIDAAFFAAIILLGMVVQSRRAYATEAAQRIQLAVADRERVANELRVARLVQQQFLPSELPELPDWRVAAFYRSAREVGGDFYNFIELPTGGWGITIGDVTDKGAPAALVMATTQGLLSTQAPSIGSPSALLEKINAVLVRDTPERMFVTCQYLVLDPTTGRLQFANAGHNLPYISTDDGVFELRATGLPLGILPGTTYEMKDAVVSPGTRLLLHSDGVSEAHNSEQETFGLPRIMRVMKVCHGNEDLIDALLTELDRFTGPEWEQEDDITLVALERLQPSGTRHTHS